MHTEREQELTEFIAWTKANPKDWNRICNPESYEVSAEYIFDLAKRLCAENFLTAAYMIIHINWTVKEVEWAISTTIKESLEDTQKDVLMYRFLQNLKATMHRCVDDYE